MKKDLVSQTFGRLTVLEETEERSSTGRGIVWICRCSCGNNIKTTTNHLTTGRTKSCGCLHKERSAEQGRLSAKDFSKIVINGVLFIEQSVKSHHNYKWRARCPICKNEDWLVVPSMVRSGNSTRCSKCNKNSRISKVATVLLDKVENYLNTPIIREYKLKDSYFDGYVPKFHTLLESDGSFWHSIPSAKENDAHKNSLAKENGFKLIRVKNDCTKDIDKAFEEIITALDLSKINR